MYRKENLHVHTSFHAEGAASDALSCFNMYTFRALYFIEALYCQTCPSVLVVLLAAGTAGQKYVHDSHVSYTGPSLDCEFLQGNVATKQDCSTAIRQLQDKNSTSCVVTNNATTQNPGQYSAVLAQFGTCQVTLGAMYNKEASLPCYALASYATNVTSACQDLQGATGGTLFPTGIPRNASVGNGIFLTVDYPRS